MKTILSNGEDALTWMIVSNDDHLRSFLRKLGDDTDPKECLVWYRPSFGRGGNLGEFDAIIRASHKVYLVEAKWDRSAEVRRTRPVIIRKEQARRHAELRMFLARKKGRASKVVKDRPDAILAANLSFIRERIGSIDKEDVVNVCLVFIEEGVRSRFTALGEPPEGNLQGEAFQIIVFTYPVEGETNTTFFNMGARLKPDDC